MWTNSIPTTLGLVSIHRRKTRIKKAVGGYCTYAEDFKTKKQYEDPAFPCSWHIDIHNPHETYDDDLKGQEFISRATTVEEFEYGGLYWAPYRTLYSRNIGILFMAGCDISVTKEGLGPVRVMRTCGMMGEIVGKAASICIKHEASPREIYEKYLDELQALMKKPGNERV